jgi:hypothetical protein
MEACVGALVVREVALYVRCGHIFFQQHSSRIHRPVERNPLRYLNTAHSCVPSRLESTTLARPRYTHIPALHPTIELRGHIQVPGRAHLEPLSLMARARAARNRNAGRGTRETGHPVTPRYHILTIHTTRLSAASPDSGGGNCGCREPCTARPPPRTKPARALERTTRTTQPSRGEAVGGESQLPHFLRGGVSGREPPMPKPANFCLSAGLRMRKEHMRLSSTDMIAPALSNSPQ